jgi:hypothetical protein
MPYGPKKPVHDDIQNVICNHTIAENGRKCQHNLSIGQKKVPKGQFLQGSRNWQKCSALDPAVYYVYSRRVKKGNFWLILHKYTSHCAIIIVTKMLVVVGAHTCQFRFGQKIHWKQPWLRQYVAVASNSKPINRLKEAIVESIRIFCLHFP